MTDPGNGSPATPTPTLVGIRLVRGVIKDDGWNGDQHVGLDLRHWVHQLADRTEVENLIGALVDIVVELALVVDQFAPGQADVELDRVVVEAEAYGIFARLEDGD